MKKTRSALAIVGILVVAGCSSTSDTDTGAPTTESPLSTTTTAVTTTVAEPSETTTTRAPDSTTSVPVTTTVAEPPETTTTLAPDSTPSVPVTTSIPSDQVITVEVLVYLLGGPNADPENYDCSAVSPVVRSVRPPALLSAAFEALLSGPTDEEREAGYDSWFSSDTGWTLRSVTIVDGVAWIDFSEDSPLINNASTSCGSAGFLAQLDSTASQFSTVDRAVYSFGGDPVPFYEWLQRDPPDA